MDFLTTFQKQYATESLEVVIRDRRFNFLVPTDLESFINPNDLFHDFPLWSKVWEASMALADFLAAKRPEPEKRFLEIGAGIGFVGIVAAAFGHHMTISEINPHALDFIRANSLVNQCPNIEIVSLDWNDPGIDGGFDYIVGSEVVYHEKDFGPLQHLIERLLKPGGKVFLCSEVRKVTLEFYQRLQPFYNMSAQKKKVRSQDQEIPIILCRIAHKD